MRKKKKQTQCKSSPIEGQVLITQAFAENVATCLDMDVQESGEEENESDDENDLILHVEDNEEDIVYVPSLRVATRNGTLKLKGKWNSNEEVDCQSSDEEIDNLEEEQERHVVTTRSGRRAFHVSTYCVVCTYFKQ